MSATRHTPTDTDIARAVARTMLSWLATIYLGLIFKRKEENKRLNNSHIGIIAQTNVEYVNGIVALFSSHLVINKKDYKIENIKKQVKIFK